MNDVTSKSKLTMTVTFEVPVEEARMLVEMTGYGADAFLDGYYKVLGKSYMKPHENALKSFFSRVRSQLPPHIRRYDETLKTMQKQLSDKR